MLSEPRVVLDTQILLRGALARTQSLTARIYDAWRDRRFILLVSDSILTEVEMVTARPEVLRKLRVTSRETRAGPGGRIRVITARDMTESEKRWWRRRTGGRR